MIRTKDDTIELVLSYIHGKEPISAAELAEGYGLNLSRSTISRHLKTLFERRLLERQWDGNPRFGRFLYRRIDRYTQPDPTWERSNIKALNRIRSATE